MIRVLPPCPTSGMQHRVELSSTRFRKIVAGLGADGQTKVGFAVGMSADVPVFLEDRVRVHACAQSCTTASIPCVANTPMRLELQFERTVNDDNKV